MAFITRVSGWPGLLDRKFHVYDALRIAEVIIEQLIPSAGAIDDLTEQLPALINIIDDNANTLSVPKARSGHVSRK